jgi:hypothetical protein
VKISANNFNTAARRSDGSLVVWGENSYGQCNVPPLLAGTMYAEVSAGVGFITARIEPNFSVTPFCFGDGTGAPCPCGNTGTLGHGCDNSGLTGGAELTSSGNAILAGDSLLLTSSGERPTSASVFCQGDTEIVQASFGDGLRCTGGHVKRLYFRNANEGVVIAPFGADPSVSDRSAAMGYPIRPGATRVYQVSYRDPNPNFCPSPGGSTFNLSNGLRVTWQP